MLQQGSFFRNKTTACLYNFLIFFYQHGKLFQFPSKENTKDQNEKLNKKSNMNLNLKEKQEFPPTHPPRKLKKIV